MGFGVCDMGCKIEVESDLFFKVNFFRVHCFILNFKVAPRFFWLQLRVASCCFVPCSGNVGAKVAATLPSVINVINIKGAPEGQVCSSLPESSACPRRESRR